ncbi:ankyrin repeat domain-containing protein [Serratia sp. UGAL515B_01]|uniref:ankyrin repeat domain-containing protein n=1 Tax=Serratia sp. UGAL515B_01 TaxID=2986763 RepID=UPI0029534AC5|nr:ankyrin repeat domain-containing protein [Serratia sp. UGAL515B_01]WON77170.1 ankyrin repeat domain-containing protein [Serratia sp. UGAL515B_01]
MFFRKSMFIIGLIATISASAFAKDVTIPQVNADNPPALADYRLSYAEMRDIADAKKLSHRVFYIPSVGPDAAWFDAVKKGNLAEIKKMVAGGQNLEAKDEAMFGQTALGWAAFIGYQDIVRYLVKQGADLFATDRADVKSAFKSAVLGKNVEVVKYIYPMVKDKIDVNDQTLDNEGESLVMIAASNNRIDVVKYLISLGANLNLVSTELDQSALTYACERGHQDMVKLLIDNGAINHRTKKPSC